MFAMLDQQVAELLNHAEKFASALFDQHMSEQSSQGAHVPPQRRVFRWVRGSGGQLSEAAGMVVRGPKMSVSHGSSRRTCG